MRTIILIFCICLVMGIGGCEQKKESPKAGVAPVSEKYEGIIAAVGDSLTEGNGVLEEEAYPVLLERKLREDGYQFKVINAGISGETSSGTRSRIQWILTLKPDIVILETGANDGLRGIDPKVTGQNLDEIVRIFKEKGVIVVLAGMRMVQNLGEEYTQAFREIYPACAQKHGTIFIPFFLEGVAGNQGVNQRDGIHPTAEGYKRVVQTIYPHIKEAVELWRKQKTGPAEITGKEPIGGNK